MSAYEHLSRGTIEARLEAAEKVCAVYGWCGINLESDRHKATLALWREWVEAGGDPSPAGHPDLDDRAIAKLAESA